MQSRRQFLGTLGMALAAAMVSGSAIAHVAVTENKYEKALRLCDELGIFYKATRNKSESGVMFDELLTFMLAEFEAPAARQSERGQIEFKQMSRIFRETGFASTAIRETPPSVLDSVVVVGIVRELLVIHRVTFNPSGFASWDLFSERYEDLVLTA